jgi:hypothetical protein
MNKQGSFSLILSLSTQPTQLSPPALSTQPTLSAHSRFASPNDRLFRSTGLRFATPLDLISRFAGLRFACLLIPVPLRGIPLRFIPLRGTPFHFASLLLSPFSCLPFFPSPLSTLSPPFFPIPNIIVKQFLTIFYKFAGYNIVFLGH